MSGDPLDGLVLGPGYPHGSNLHKKLRTSGSGQAQAMEIAVRYIEWRTSAESSKLDGADPAPFASTQTQLFNGYRDVLDHPSLDVEFDSRGALQSSALEEFCRYLLEPVVRLALGEEAGSVRLGHFDVYQGLFFTSPSFAEFARLPVAHYPKVNMDFVIAKRVESALNSDEEMGSSMPVYLPAVAIECKTYLDRPRYHAADGNAVMVKGGFPGCLYVVLAEMLKLDLEGVNVHGSRIDHIYVLRKSRNVDRKRRRRERTSLPPVQPDAVLDLLERVREHLLEDWSEPGQWERTGRLK